MKKKIILIAAICIFAHLHICTSANVPGGGTGTGADVTVKDNGSIVVLDNGIVSVTVNKADATITSYTYKGMDLLAGGNGGVGGKFYWDWNMPTTYETPKNGTYALTVNPTGNNGDYAEIRISFTWSGNSTNAAMDVAVYYSLPRGAQGYYVTATLSHPANYPDNPGGQFRCNTYIGSIFDWLCVDSTRNKMMATVADWGSATVDPGIPPEVRLLKTGIHTGRYECKYGYSADLGDLNVWGWVSSAKHVGIWMTVPSHEYYNGGPMKRALTGHIGHCLLNMLNGTHYGTGNSTDMAEGTSFQKTYGPFFIYANSYTGSANDSISTVANSLWKDAQAQALAEQSAWPYTWFKNTAYIQKSGRGTVTGILAINDSGNTMASSAGMWIGLAPNDNGTNFQYQAKTYQFWVKTDKNGNFTIPHVLPGMYNLWAFGKGTAGTFRQSNITVTAAQTLNLGTITWTPARTSPTVWEIGVPDRDSKEFYNGTLNYSLWETAYVNYPAEFPHGVNYTVGKSDWKKDWNYAQMNNADSNWSVSPWTINFELTQAPTSSSSLYLSFASSFGAHLIVMVNDTEVSSFTPSNASNAVIRLGSHGAFWDTLITISPSLLKKGNNTIVLNQSNSGRSSTIEYDYLRLEAIGTSTVTFVDNSGFDREDAKIYPNPFINTSNLSVKGAFDYRIYDMIGRIVETGHSENIASVGNDLQTGMYVVKIQNPSGSNQFMKIIKQ